MMCYRDRTYCSCSDGLDGGNCDQTSCFRHISTTMTEEAIEMELHVSQQNFFNENDLMCITTRENYENYKKRTNK